MKIKNLTLALLVTVFAATSLASSGLEGRPAPDFALKSSTGENLRLSEYRGDVVMINFWATWCGPCRQEMPLLDELYTRYQRVGFNLLGVNIDDDSRRAMQMIEELGVSTSRCFSMQEKRSASFTRSRQCRLRCWSIAKATFAMFITDTSPDTRTRISIRFVPYLESSGRSRRQENR